MNTYRITYTVTGEVTLDIDAESVEEAIIKGRQCNWGEDHEFDLSIYDTGVEEL